MADKRLPIAIEKCGVCGSKETLGNFLNEEMERQGKAIEIKPKGLSAVVMALNPARSKSLTAVQLLIYQDYCLGCGIARAVYIETQEVPYGLAQPGQQPPGAFPFGPPLNPQNLSQQ